MRILVVEDEGYILKLIKRILGGEGFDVLGETSGDDAVTRINNGDEFDLLISDYNLEDSDSQGIDVIMNFRARYPQKPVILMSGKERSLSEFGECKRIAFLRKPFTVKSITEAVSKAFD